MNTNPSFSQRSRQACVVAVVLGTALTAMGQSETQGRDLPEGTGRAVSDMTRYCTSCWRNARLHPDCWNDCTQEVFARMLQRVAPDSWDLVLQSEGDERREFVRAIDAVKKRVQRSRKSVHFPLEVVHDEREARDRSLEEERQAVQIASSEVLSMRQQQIVQYSLDGWTVHEIARELNTPAERVSDEKYKAIRKLRSHLCEA